MAWNPCEFEAGVGHGAAAQTIDEITEALFSGNDESPDAFDAWVDLIVAEPAPMNDENEAHGKPNPAALVDQAATCFFPNSESESESESEAEAENEAGPGLVAPRPPSVPFFVHAAATAARTTAPPRAAAFQSPFGGLGLSVPVVPQAALAAPPVPVFQPKPQPAAPTRPSPEVLFAAAVAASQAAAAEAVAAGQQLVLFSPGGEVGFPSTRAYRKGYAIPKYLCKRARRKWEANPMYATRTNAAHKRARVKGKFTTKGSFVSASACFDK